MPVTCLTVHPARLLTFVVLPTVWLLVFTYPRMPDRAEPAPASGPFPAKLALNRKKHWVS
jgi:hypothetical protein